MEFNSYTPSYTEDGLRKHMLKTHTWMALGVLVTFSVAYFISMNFDLAYSLLQYQFILLIAQIGVVFGLGMGLTKMKPSTAKILFFSYSVLTGITFSVFMFAYSLETIILAFGMSVVFYGSLVIIGTTTKADLSKIGSICYAGLLAMIIYTLLSFLFGWPTDTLMYSIIGLILFMGITAWDTQKAKQLYMASADDSAMAEKMGVYSAFQLYLDFINIFLYILRIVGKGRD